MKKKIPAVLQYCSLFVICCLLAGVMAFKPITPHRFTIHFNHQFGGRELKLMGEEKYINSFGEPLLIARFRYYVSNIVLEDEQGKKFPLRGSYYLVDEEDSSSKTISLPVAGGKIKTVQFLLGVDSIRNCSGVQTGVLDPLKGMFWTWNSGYIFAKLEGYSDSSHAPAHYFTYHVGGYKKNENAARTIRLELPASQQDKNSITINADAGKWFKAIHEISTSRSPVCHSPGALALQLADNYSTMFSIAQ